MSNYVVSSWACICEHGGLIGCHCVVLVLSQSLWPQMQLLNETLGSWEGLELSVLCFQLVIPKWENGGQWQ